MPVLRVMTYNIKGGRNHPDGLEALARVIETAAPDIVGLQEVDNVAARSGRVGQAGWLARRLGMQYVFGASLAFADGGDYGNALLSRHPILTKTVKSLYQPNGERRPVLASSAETWLNADEPRSLLRVVVEVDGTLVNVLVTHLGLTPEQRLKQVAEVIDSMRVWLPNHPLVLMGDFNALPGSQEVALVRDVLSDAFENQPLEFRSTRRYSAGETAGAPDAAACLDYVFVGPDVAVEGVRVLNDAGEASDHLPMLVSLRFAAQDESAPVND